MFAGLLQRCRQAGTHIFLSSDGYVLEIADDLMECGIAMLDPQLRANSLKGILRAYKGKIRTTVDLDRQGLTFLTPQGIDEQVKEVVDAVGDAKGALMIAGRVWGADVPLRSIAALCEAIESYCFP